MMNSSSPLSRSRQPRKAVTNTAFSLSRASSSFMRAQALSTVGDVGTAILISANGTARLGPIRADGTSFKPEKQVDRQWPFGRTARFRLLLKHSLLEFYLDDLLIECYSMPQWAGGRVGVVRGESRQPVEDLRAWR